MLLRKRLNLSRNSTVSQHPKQTKHFLQTNRPSRHNRDASQPSAMHLAAHLLFEPRPVARVGGIPERPRAYAFFAPRLRVDPTPLTLRPRGYATCGGWRAARRFLEKSRPAGGGFCPRSDNCCVERERAAKPPTVLRLNFQGFVDGCRWVDLSLGKEVFQMQRMTLLGGLKQLGHLPLSEPHRALFGAR